MEERNPYYANARDGQALEVGDIVRRVTGPRHLRRVHGVVVSLWYGLASVAWSNKKNPGTGIGITGTRLVIVHRPTEDERKRRGAATEAG